MAVPNLLLREFQAEGISILIPGKLAQTYEQLEKLAFGIFSKESHRWTVHFHLEDGECEGKALPFLWNTGAYFDEAFVKSGKLSLFAHFQSTGRLRGSMATPSSGGHHSVRNVALPTPMSTSDNSIPSVNITKMSMRRSKPERVLDFDDFPDEEDVHFDNDDAMPADNCLPLPADATVNNWGIDIEAYKHLNAASDHYGHKHNWNTISKDYRMKAAHARLIHGRYGTPAPVSCQNCVMKGIECRIYHPDLDIAGLGSSCGECRLHSFTCSISSRAGRHSRTKMQKLEPVVHENDAVTEDSLFFCPVLNCDRSQEGFARRDNCKRHVELRHPGTPIPDALLPPARAPISRKPTLEERIFETPTIEHETNDNDEGTGPILCLVPGCDRARKVSGFSTKGNRNQHIRHFHPESVYLITNTEQRGRKHRLSDTPSLDNDNCGDDGDDTFGTLYCPVPECSRTAGFIWRSNLTQHIRDVHPTSTLAIRSNTSRDVDVRSTSTLAIRPAKMAKTDTISIYDGTILSVITPKGTQLVHTSILTEGLSKGKTQFHCPVPGCERDTGITPYCNFRLHVSSKHPGCLIFHRKPKEVVPAPRPVIPGSTAFKTEPHEDVDTGAGANNFRSGSIGSVLLARRELQQAEDSGQELVSPLGGEEVMGEDELARPSPSNVSDEQDYQGYSKYVP